MNEERGDASPFIRHETGSPLPGGCVILPATIKPLTAMKGPGYEDWLIPRERSQLRVP